MQVNERGEIHFDWSGGLPSLPPEQANTYFKGTNEYKETIWDRIKSKFSWSPVSQAPGNTNTKYVYDGYVFDPKLSWLVNDLRAGTVKLDGFADTVDWSKAETNYVSINPVKAPPSTSIENGNGKDNTFVGVMVFGILGIGLILLLK